MKHKYNGPFPETLWKNLRIEKAVGYGEGMITSIGEHKRQDVVAGFRPTMWVNGTKDIWVRISKTQKANVHQYTKNQHVSFPEVDEVFGIRWVDETDDEDWKRTQDENSEPAK